MDKAGLRILATRYRTDSCCRIMECEEVVVVGGASGALLPRAAVQTKVGAGEAAVVIPKKPIS
jgi:hypothetical protein